MYGSHTPLSGKVQESARKRGGRQGVGGSPRKSVSDAYNAASATSFWSGKARCAALEVRDLIETLDPLPSCILSDAGDSGDALHDRRRLLR